MLARQRQEINHAVDERQEGRRQVRVAGGEPAQDPALESLVVYENRTQGAQGGDQGFGKGACLVLAG